MSKKFEIINVEVDVIEPLEKLAKTASLISLDDSSAFYGWEKDFKSICYRAGEVPYKLCGEFYSRHLSGPIILGQTMPLSRGEIMGLLNDAPELIETIVNFVRYHGVTPVKTRTKSRQIKNSQTKMKTTRKKRTKRKRIKYS